MVRGTERSRAPTCREFRDMLVSDPEQRGRAEETPGKSLMKSCAVTH